MRLPSAWPALAFMPTEQALWWALWGGLIALTLVLVLLMCTRWGQSQPLRKCVILSVFAHLLMAGYAATVQIVEAAMGPAEEPHIRIAVIDGLNEEPDAKPNKSPAPKPWDAPPQQTPQIPVAEDLERPVTTTAAPSKRELTRDQWKLDDDSAPAELPLATAKLPLPGAPETEKHLIDQSPLESPTPTERAPPQRREAVAPFVPESQDRKRNTQTAESVPKRQSVAAPKLDDETAGESPNLPTLTDVVQTPNPASSLSGLVDSPLRPDSPLDATTADQDAARVNESRDTIIDDASQALREPGSTSLEAAKVNDVVGRNASGAASDASTAPLVPLTPQPALNDRESAADKRTADLYQNRSAPDRLRIAEQYGGSAETEGAVDLALAWLAAIQSNDGRWDADLHGGGRDRRVDDHDRRSAGTEADTGITGLALLAFMGAGHTHTTGDHRRSVERGLDYLLSVQARDGNLGGRASTYAFMYCHGMATLALGEAYAMTGDERIVEPLQRAVRYTLRAQHPNTGGWRYHPGDLGDTSQLGWQLMALKSSEHGGITIPATCRTGMIRFLDSVTSGRAGGLASYRPGERPSRTMTAEALACREFLGIELDLRTEREATAYLIEELPGEGERNFYYWYYATLAMHQMQDESWQRWNEALKKTLVSSQRNTGPLSGSWDPSTRWGGYGGRAFTTAMGALCLEVYYRYLPLYEKAGEIARHRRGGESSGRAR